MRQKLPNFVPNIFLCQNGQILGVFLDLSVQKPEGLPRNASLSLAELSARSVFSKEQTMHDNNALCVKQCNYKRSKLSKSRILLRREMKNCLNIRANIFYKDKL